MRNNMSSRDEYPPVVGRVGHVRSHRTPAAFSSRAQIRHFHRPRAGGDELGKRLLLLRSMAASNTPVARVTRNDSTLKTTDDRLCGVAERGDYDVFGVAFGRSYSGANRAGK